MNDTASTAPIFTAEKQSDSEVWILEDGLFADSMERMVGEDTDEMMWRAERRCENLTELFA